MFLQEEYLQRHGIVDVPIIVHTIRGSLLLRPKGFSYLVVVISWKPSNRGPGRYHINYYTPIHNGYSRNLYFSRISEVECVLEWEEYSTYIINWSSKNRLNPVLTEAEVYLSIWEMFLFCCDDALASLGLEKLLYESINEDNPIDKRYSSFLDCMDYLRLNHPDLSNLFKDNFLSHVFPYCFWLSKLISDNNAKIR
jgi:hypothetical protein